MGLTNLGIFHTIIGIIAIAAGIASYVKYGRINLRVLSGKLYLIGTLSACLTALGLSKAGGFNPGHILSLMVIVLVLAAVYLNQRRRGNTSARFFENFCLSFSFFLSLIPTVAETFQRIPVGDPLAKSQGDPVIGKTLLTLFVLFVAGSIYQFIIQKRINGSARK
ncbi:MAG TPA: hypothetical protein VGD40_21070 [Chryseosolibacter sp.]